MNDFINTLPSGRFETYTENPREIYFNQYFAENPHQIIGEITLDQTTLGKRIACKFLGTDAEFIQELRRKIVGKEINKDDIPYNVCSSVDDQEKEKQTGEAAMPNVKIPSSKFVKESCYSFIVRFSKQLEIYFHPEVEVDDKFKGWLKRESFIQNKVTPQQWSAALSRQRADSARDLLERAIADGSGAYEIEVDVELSKIPDIIQSDIAEPEEDITATITKAVAEKVSSEITKNIDAHLIGIKEQLREEIEAASNTGQIEEYESTITKLNNQVVLQQSQIKELNDTLDKVKGELHKVKVTFGMSENDHSAIFEDHDEERRASETSHLNVLFDREKPLSENAITDESQYDDKTYNEIIETPASDDLSDLDLDDLETTIDNPPSSYSPDTLDIADSELDDLDKTEAIKPYVAPSKVFKESVYGLDIDADLDSLAKSNGHATAKK